jgi:ABC-type Na+ efflux pump permease subunit
MSKTFVIAGKDITETFRNKLLYFYIALFFIIGFVYLDNFNSLIAAQETEDPLLSIQSGIDYLFVIMPLTLAMLACTIFSGYSIIMEKSRRSMESLLATPVTISDVWLGKSLASAIPSTIIAIMISFLVLIGINVRASAGYIFPSALPLITGLAIVPLLIFLIILIVSFIQLITANQMVGRLAFVGIFLITFLGTTLFNPGTPENFALMYAIIAILLAGSTRSIKKLLTKERVVLSSKG